MTERTINSSMFSRVIFAAISFAGRGSLSENEESWQFVLRTEGASLFFKTVCRVGCFVTGRVGERGARGEGKRSGVWFSLEDQPSS